MKGEFRIEAEKRILIDITDFRDKKEFDEVRDALQAFARKYKTARNRKRKILTK